MSEIASTYERIFGPFLGPMLEHEVVDLIDLKVGYQERPMSFKDVMCLSLRKAFESMSLYFELPRLKKTGPHDAELVFEWHINWDAYVILSKARALGCEWAEKVDTKPPGPIGIR
jgi:hypothetical protein